MPRLRRDDRNRPACKRTAVRPYLFTMSGILFDDPDLRFSRRLRLFVFKIPGFALLLFRWLTKADRSSRSSSRQLEVEFPAAAQTASQLPKRTLWGSPAVDRASIDALHSHNNWVNIEDQYEISFIWEKLAAFARRVPTERRSSPWFARDRQNPGQENILATHRRIFFQWKNCEQASRVITQRYAAGATGAQG
jgi:hypothetical protein